MPDLYPETSRTPWWEATCELCFYNIKGKCRRFPPTSKMGLMEDLARHPQVVTNTGPPLYMDACSEYVNVRHCAACRQVLYEHESYCSACGKTKINEVNRR